MFSITIWFGPTNAVVTLLYKTIESQAKAAAAAGTGTELPICSLDDDYGQHLVINGSLINAMMLESLDHSMHGRIAIALHQARTQAKAQQTAQGDPVLKAASAIQRSGPAMIDPFANGQMRS